CQRLLERRDEGGAGGVEDGQPVRAVQPIEIPRARGARPGRVQATQPPLSVSSKQEQTSTAAPTRLGNWNAGGRAAKSRPALVLKRKPPGRSRCTSPETC